MLVSLAQISQPFVIADVPDPVPLDPHRVRSPVLRDLEQHWWGLHEDERVPPRTAFPPERLRAALGRVMVLQVEDGPNGHRLFRYRLFGTDMCKFHGRDMTGLTTDEFASPDFASAVRRQNEAALARGTPTSYAICVGDGEVHYQYEKLILPVAADDGETHLIVCSFPLDGLAET